MKQKKTFIDVIIQLLFVMYMYALFKIIVFKFGSIDMTYLWQQLKKSLGNPDDMNSRLQEGNLIPFHEISRTIYHISSHGLFNLIGNIAIFIPYGIFLVLMSKSKRITFIGAFIRSLGLSLILESTQVLFSIGRFDVDDLILNSIGGMVGFIVFRGNNNSVRTSVLLA